MCEMPELSNRDLYYNIDAFDMNPTLIKDNVIKKHSSLFNIK